MMLDATLTVRRATVEDAALVADLVSRLLQELGGFGMTTEQISALAATLLPTESYLALLAFAGSAEPIGVLTLNECTALYLGGRLGWMQELYVIPALRSSQVGHMLIQAAVDIARQRQWRRIEVNTPDASAWPRTVAFYRREGFIGESVHLRLPL